MGAKKGTIPQSTVNRVWFKYAGLFIFKLLYDNNKKKGEKLSKRDLCIYLAQNNKTFRGFWMKSHPKKKYPKDKKDRKEVGLDFYHNIIADKRRFKDLNYLNDIIARGDKKAFYYSHEKGKLKRRRYR